MQVFAGQSRGSSLSHPLKQHLPSSVAFKAIRAAEACSLLLGPMELS
jgi:hypothetical protein